jgi:hypothetical protein
MRKRRFVIGLVTSMALALGVFFGGRAASAAGADIYGVGGGRISLGVVQFAKFAFSGHTGSEGDFGSFRIAAEDPTDPTNSLDIHVDVDCVNVFPVPLGGGGWMGGPVKKVTPQPNLSGIEPGDQLVIGFNDFGEPSDPIPDQWTAELGAPQLCKVLGPSIHFPVTQGNIVVKFE